MEINLSEYEKVELFREEKPKIGDLVYHLKTKKVEFVITENTDLIQEEFYPLIENFGCILLRKKLV